MKIVIAQMKHETNTYSPVPTPLARFALGGEVPPSGRDAYAAYQGTGSAIGAFIELAESVQARRSRSRSPPAPGRAARSRTAPTSSSASSICDAVAAGCDAVLLDLHGAMVTQTHEDGEGELLRRLRAINADRADRRGAGHAHQLLPRDRRARHGHCRLPDLPARRHVRDRPARRPRDPEAAVRQGQARDGLGQPADAAACDAPGQRRFAESRAAAALPRDGARRRAVRVGVRRLSERRHHQRRPVGGGRDRRRRRARPPLVRRAAGDGVGQARRLRLPHRAVA